MRGLMLLSDKIGTRLRVSEWLVPLDPFYQGLGQQLMGQVDRDCARIVDGSGE